MSRLAFAQPAFIALFAVCAAACVVRPTTEPATEIASAAPEPQADSGEGAVVCRNYNSTGSRVRREKVCMTVAQWDDVNEDAEGYARGLQNNGSMQPGGQTLETGP